MTTTNDTRPAQPTGGPALPTAREREIAHEALSSACEAYAQVGDHTQICDWVTAALASYRESLHAEVLEEAAKHLENAPCCPRCGSFELIACADTHSAAKAVRAEIVHRIRSLKLGTPGSAAKKEGEG